MTPDEARALILKERTLIGHWELQRRGRDTPDNAEITLAQVTASLQALIDAAQHVPDAEAEDVLRLVNLTHTRIKLKYGMED